jgi:hypothetical protein
MIDNVHGLFVALHQLTRFADMLEALRLDAEERADYGQFAHLSQSYPHRIREPNGAIREYLRTHPDENTAPGAAAANQ